MIRVVNVDWLSLYCIGGNQYDLSRKIAQLGYCVVDRQTATRHFRKVLDVYTKDNFPVFEVQCEPSSLKRDGGIWRIGACIVKVNNRHLYMDGEIERVYTALSSVGIEVISISRLDIAMDFQYFDNGLSPRTFIRNFHKNKYWKIGSKKFTAIGTIDENIDYEYIRFGAPTSSVKVYLYNKSRELDDVKDKPYIRAVWMESGMEKGDVWRLEVSIKSDATQLVDLSGEVRLIGGNRVNVETGNVLGDTDITTIRGNGKVCHVVPVNLDAIRNTDRILSTYNKFINHFFRFRYKEKGVRKDRAKDVKLLNISEFDKAFRPVKILKAKDSGKMDRFVMKYLTQLADVNPELLDSVYAIKKDMAERFCFKEKTCL